MCDDDDNNNNNDDDNDDADIGRSLGASPHASSANHMPCVSAHNVDDSTEQ